MLIRDSEDIPTVDWGNGTSRRMLTCSDRMGFSVTETVVRKGTSSQLQYRRHLEACYCVSGCGELIDISGNRYSITPGRLYALEAHDAHTLVAAPCADLRLICVFTPALKGDETHVLTEDGYSSY